MTSHGSTIRDELHTLTLEEVTPAQFKTAIGKVYLGPVSEIATQDDCVQMVDSYRAVHTPTMGQSIPGTAEISEATASDGSVFTVHKPAAGEVFQLNAAQHSNANAVTPGTVSLVLVNAADETVRISQATGTPPQQTAALAGKFNPITYDDTVWVGAICSDGTVTDQTVAIASIKVVQ